MGFGWPTRYLILDDAKVEGGAKSWDGELEFSKKNYLDNLKIFLDAVDKASNEYSKRMHNLFWDNCHSHCG